MSGHDPRPGASNRPESAAGAGTGAAGLPPALAARAVGKRYGRVVALDDVSLEVRSGSVTCLLGDNGAGKSTLIQLLAGVHRPTSGAIEVDGRPASLDSPRAARSHGIATVHQDPAVIPLMSVWRNFFLGREPTLGRGPLRRLDVDRARSETRSALAGFGIHVDDVDRPLATLSGGERQSVAIARAAHTGARVLILDEPTAALGVKQAGLVLDRVEAARDAGLAVLLVSHNPHHAARVGDAFVVLRHGRVAARRGTGTGAEELGPLMAGGGGGEGGGGGPDDSPPDAG